MKVTITKLKPIFLCKCFSFFVHIGIQDRKHRIENLLYVKKISNV